MKRWIAVLFVILTFAPAAVNLSKSENYTPFPKCLPCPPPEGGGGLTIASLN